MNPSFSSPLSSVLFPSFVFVSEVSEILRALLILSNTRVENGLAQESKKERKNTLFRVIHFSSAFITLNAVSDNGWLNGLNSLALKTFAWAQKHLVKRV